MITRYLLALSVASMLVPVVALAQSTSSSSAAPFTVPPGAPPVVSNCVTSLNSVYEARAQGIITNGDAIGQNNKPSNFSCLGGLMQGMTLGWPSIDLSSILQQLENLACTALTNVLNAQMTAFGSTVELPGGLGTVSVLPSYQGGVNTNPNNASSVVATSIWNTGPGQLPIQPPIKNPYGPGGP